MYCLNCQSSALPLVDMRSQFLKLQDHQIDVLNVFVQCKQVKIEQPENAKLCSACVLSVCQEFCSKFVHYSPNSANNFPAPTVAKSQETVIVKNEVQQQQQAQQQQQPPPHQQQQQQHHPFIVNNGMQQYLISFPQHAAQNQPMAAQQMPFNAYQPHSVQHKPTSANVSSVAATSMATASSSDASKLCAIIQDGKQINILTDTGEVTQTNIPKCTMCNRTLKTFASLITHMSSGKCTKKPQKSKNKSHSNA